jgi:hypothetical protein
LKLPSGCTALAVNAGAGLPITAGILLGGKRLWHRVTFDATWRTALTLRPRAGHHR